ncbi:SAV_6107 family HEPN domain-containing protein [Streptomyces sp. NPDC014940]|uniref:SAV_6107 family HEPN domain-containing protein n=1 Tax=Streptomyces sp. NPDC014940 TaxID=3364932 RepID=UPI0037008E86
MQSRWELVSHRIRPAPGHFRQHHQAVDKPRFIGRASTPPAALDLLAQARAGLDEAATRADPNERYATAHLAALRAAAAVLAVRGRPEPSPAEGRRRIRSAWEVLPEIAPELTEWAALFAAGAARRARAEAGIAGAASRREADDLLRDVNMFVRLVERMLPHLPAPDLLELTENQDTGAAVRHLSHGFDELFKALGPPPPGLKQQQSVVGGGGGTAR